MNISIGTKWYIHASGDWPAVTTVGGHNRVRSGMVYWTGTAWSERQEDAKLYDSEAEAETAKRAIPATN